MSTKVTRCAVVALLALVGLFAPGNTAFGQFLPGGGIDTPDPNLPPAGVYLTPSDVHTMYTAGALTVVLKAAQHRPFAPGQTHDNPDGSQTDSFNSELNGKVDVVALGVSNSPADLLGPTSVVVFGKVGNTTGTFNTEMISLDLSGVVSGIPVMIRESPTLQSTGQTRITDIGGGLYHIDSFFDVFTELSADGGASWIPSTSAAHVNLVPVPEPASVVLFGLGAFACLGLAVRRKQK